MSDTENNKDNKVNLDSIDRGSETLEELEARLPQAAIDLANENTANVVARKKKEARKFNHRNRDAWRRMNRPEKLKRIEDNMERILNFCGFKGYVLDSQLPKDTKDTKEPLKSLFPEVTADNLTADPSE